ncbi:MAG: enoyl-CoA hydratase [Micropepsaceae bacterium]
MTSKLIAEIHGSTGTLVLNAPERRNALSLDMWQAIPGLVEEFEKDLGIRSIVVRGAGSEAFAAGADISEFEANRATDESAKAYDAATGRATLSLSRCSKPVIAAVQGICFGGGMALAMACDLRLATDNSRFCIPAAKLGIGYGFAGTAALVAKLGPSCTAEMLFTAKVYSAHEALMRGIVQAVAPVADFDNVLKGYTTMLGQNAPLSILASKKAIQAALSHDANDRSEADRAVAACMASADYAEGRKAFLEKRKPAFHGK